jgi:EmrB/QacA subfamily drug resistance transporter
MEAKLSSPPGPEGQDPSKKWWVLAAIGVGTFMSALDGSVVNTLLPVMRGALQTTVAGVEWVVTIYLLVVSGVLLAFGRLGDLRGHKDVYLAGFAGFGLSSALCGLSPSVEWLVAFRAVQAVSAAMLFANAPAILTRAFPPAQRGRALGLQATMTYLGLSTGPLLGGLLAHRFGWQSVFFVNVPVALVGSFMGQRFIERDRPRPEAPAFDLAGAGLFFAGLFTLLLALNQGHAWGWTAPATLGLLAFAGLALTAFFAVERKQLHPMLDLSLFERPAFSGAVFSALATYVAIYAILFLVPFYLIQGRHLDPQHAGYVLTAQPLVMMLTAPLAGALSDRVGSRGLVLAGLAIFTVGALWLAHAVSGGLHVQVPLALAVCGLGSGSFTAPNNSRLLGAAPRNRQGIASGVLAAARSVGMVLGVGIAGAVYTTVLVRGDADGNTAAVVGGLRVSAAVLALALATSWLEGRGERAR